MAKRSTGIHQAQDGTWKVDKVYKNRRIQRRFGADFGEAESFLIQELARLAHAQQLGRVRHTFEQAATHYVELYQRKLSIQQEIAWLNELMPFIGDLPLDRIYDKTLKPFVDAQRQKPIMSGKRVIRHGVKSKTINLKLGMVRHILRLASRSWRTDEGETWLPAAPLITMVEGGDEREPRQLTWTEQREHLHKLPGHLQRMALFMLQCGCRDEVVCSLRWEWEVLIPELEILTFIVPPESVKGQRGKKTSRVLVCNSVARSIVEQVRGQHDEYVFVYQHNRARWNPENKRPKPFNELPHRIETMNNTAWQKWRARSGLGDLHVHDLRHTVGMRLREAGVPEDTRADILWHSRKSMTRHYSVAQVMEIFGALEKIRDETNTFNKSLASIARDQARVTTNLTTKKNAA